MFDENQETLICRTCLEEIGNISQSISIHTYAKTLLFENLLIKEMIEKCIPEMDLEICDNTVICTTCYALLINTYTFKSKCFDTEERIYMFIEKKNLKIGDKLYLNRVLEENITSYPIYEKKHSENYHQQNKETDEVIINVTDTEDEDINVVDDTGNYTQILEKPYKSPKKRYPPREHPCDLCEYKAERKDLLQRHVTYNCKNRIKSNRYKCDLCSYSTVRKRHLTRHKFTHGGKRPFVCGLCDKGFTEKNNIKRHILKHSGYKLQYKCEEEDCKAVYRQKCDLSAHMATHVKHFKPFMCKLCNEPFPDEMQWTLHMDKVHDLYLFLV